MIALAEQKQKPLRPGDACPFADCAGRIATYSTRINFNLDKRFRHFCCPACHREETYGKFCIPLEYAPPRTRGSK